MSIHCIAFDLDDTLIDTTHLLVPNAAQAACEEMIRLGLRGTLEECLKIRKQLATSMSHQKIFLYIAEKFQVSDPANVAARSYEVFHTFPIPEQLPLVENAQELLIALKEEYRLFLVTSGLRSTQEQKIRAAGVGGYFEDIFICDKFHANETKESAFRKIISATQIEPRNLLSIGNRLSQEIRYAKRLGAQTCYFAFGEHVGELPEEPEDHPDFTIHRLSQMRETCHI